MTQIELSSLITAGDMRLVAGVIIAVLFSIAIQRFAIFQSPRYLCLLSLIAAALLHGRDFSGFVLVNGLAYAAVLWLSHRQNPASRWRSACFALLSLIAIFIVGRMLHWDRPIGAVGVVLYSLDMWLVLRLVTLLWEVGCGSVAAPSISRFVTWTCLPFILLGPVLRYSQLPGAVCPNRSLWKSPSWWMDVATGSAKLVTGFALPLAHLHLFKSWPNAHLLDKGINALFTGPMAFFLTGAGYFQLMELMGQSAGFTLPISYNYPFGRENISLFWANWNTTATSVFRDYLFYNRFGLTGYNVYLNTMILFALVGLWHASNAYWLLWGFSHGAMFCIFLFWRKHNQKLGRLPLRGTPVARMAARVLTYVGVCACWYLPSKILQKFGRV